MIYNHQRYSLASDLWSQSIVATHVVAIAAAAPVAAAVAVGADDLSNYFDPLLSYRILSPEGSKIS